MPKNPFAPTPFKGIPPIRGDETPPFGVPQTQPRQQIGLPTLPPPMRGEPPGGDYGYGGRPMPRPITPPPFAGGARDFVPTDQPARPTFGTPQQGMGHTYGYGSEFDALWESLPQAWRADLNRYPTEAVRQYLSLLQLARDNQRTQGKNGVVVIDNQRMDTIEAAQYVWNKMQEVKEQINAQEMQAKQAEDNRPPQEQRRISPFIARG